MSDFDFLDPSQLAEDLDRPFVAELPPSKPLVIVLGLHRSGTTFLYQLMADAFQVATTQVYHITHYRRLLWARREGLEERYRQEVRDRLHADGIADRGIDKFPVGPDNLEEYAFILRKFSPAWGFSPKSAALFDEMTRKLSFLQPEAEALLLKNPHDLITIEAMQAAYPQARFVFIRRDPVRVLNSQFRNSFIYREKPEPYLHVLLAGIPLWKWTFTLMRVADKLLPDSLYQGILIRGLRRSIAGQLRRHYQQLPSLRPDRYIELSYETLIADPTAELERLREFLGLSYKEDADRMPTSPRLEPLLAGVEAASGAFRKELAGVPDAELQA